MRVALDFAACWHSRVTARFSEYLKELSRDESLTDRAVRTDSGTTRFLSQTDLKRHFRSCPVQLIQARQHLIICHNLVVKGNHVAFTHLDGNIILNLAWRRRNRSRQIDPNTLHVGLAQTHHHKTGKQKEHDVDQWNDLDAGSFMRNRRR